MRVDRQNETVHRPARRRGGSRRLPGIEIGLAVAVAQVVELPSVPDRQLLRIRPKTLDEWVKRLREIRPCLFLR